MGGVVPLAFGGYNFSSTGPPRSRCCGTNSRLEAISKQEMRQRVWLAAQAVLQGKATLVSWGLSLRRDHRGYWRNRLGYGAG